MAKLSIREAVKFYSVSRPTLTKALKNGKLSGVQDGKGHWKIDRSELERVYSARTTDGETLPENFTTKNTPENVEIERLKVALSIAETRAEAAERLAQERGERIEDLRRLLPAPSPAPEKRSIWDWFK